MPPGRRTELTLGSLRTYNSSPSGDGLSGLSLVFHPRGLAMMRWFGLDDIASARATLVGAVVVAAIVGVGCSSSIAVADDTPPGELARIGRVLKITLPIVGDTDRLVKQFVDKSLTNARKNNQRPALIFQFEVPPGQDQYGRGSQFGASLELARYLSSEALNEATTVAYLPRSIQGHAVLVAIACDEIIMAPDASIGAAGVDEATIGDFMIEGYREIANRRRTVPVELALGMLDPAREVLDVETDVSREFVTPEGLEKLRENRTIAETKVVIASGEPGQFTGQQARQLGFVSYLASDRRAAARALELPPEAVEEDLALADTWRAARIDLRGPLDAAKIDQAQRMIDNAVRQRSANFLCVWIDSPGGSPADSIRLANYLADLSPGKVRTVAYIPSQARSDAALVALACDQVVMTPAAVLGGAGAHELSQIEVDAVTQNLREHLAPAKSRSWSLPAAMFDRTLGVYEVTRQGVKEYFCDAEREEQPTPDEWTRGAAVTTEGALFQASGVEADHFRLADHTVDNVAELRAIYGLEDDPTLVEPRWADLLVQMLATPAMAGLLLMIGGAAIYAEMHSPGVGLGGFVATVCFVVFFWSHFLGGTAGWLEVALFIAGVACLALEVFVLPGFGIFGLGGGALVVVSLILAGQTFILPQNEYQLGQLRASLLVVAGASLGIVAAAVLMNRWLPRAPILNQVMLAPLSDEAKKQLDRSESLVDFGRLLNQRGVTTTPLMPGGKARFGDEVVNVIAEGEFVSPQTTIVVVAVHGYRVMVKAVEET